MEIVVLPAQDHLAQERYRYQSRAMSGMIYPLGGLPRTRRKVKTPPPAFAVASIHSESVRVSSNQNVSAAVDLRNQSLGAAAQLDLSFGIPRGARFSSSPPSRHLSGLSTPHYRLHSTPSQGFTRSETTTRCESTTPVLSKQQQPAASPFSPSSLLNGSTQCSAPVVRTRSDGELLSSLKKGGEVEKTSERRKSFEKSLDNNNKNGYDRKVVEKAAERFEKPVDKRKVFDRKPIDKKAFTCKNQVEKPSNPPKKGIITILQRPQTKEAAAENLAKITGIAVDSLLLTKPIRQASSEVMRKDVDPVTPDVATEDVRVTEVGSKDAELCNTSTNKGRPGSPKTGKKRSVREYPRNSGGRGFVTSQIEDKVGKPVSGSHSNGHPLQAHVEKERRSKTNNEKRETSPASSHSSKDGIRASKAINANPGGVLILTPEDYSSAHTLSDSQSKKSNAKSFASTEPGHRSSDEHGGRQIAVARSDSFRDIPRRSESCEVVFLPSSPPTAAAERWAGPAYSNSPPPSTLPFPTFPTQRTKSSLNGVSLGSLLDPLVPLMPTKSSSAPSSPTRVSAAFFSENRTQTPHVDPSSATKDLRRILNLDVEGVVGAVETDVSFVPSDAELLASFLQAKEQQSATQSLKRILQLG